MAHEAIERFGELEPFSVEGEMDGRRVLLRGLQAHPEDYAGDVLPIALTLEHRYEVAREDGLPTEEQHDAYADVMMDLIDAVHEEGVGVHLCADTSDGLIREWFYVADVDAAVAVMREMLPEGFAHEIMHQRDPEWEFAEALLGQVRDEWGDQA